MLSFYCYPKCTTCQKAQKWLDAKGAAYTVINIKEQNPDAETLRALWKASGLPLKRFFNTSGQSYRSLNLTAKLPSMPEEEQLALLGSDGMLVKRPLLVGDGFVLVGFREPEWEQRISF